MSFDISSPNNILALEYIKAIKKINSKIIPIAVRRRGAGYNDRGENDLFASATYIRELIVSNKPYEKYVPPNCRELYIDALKAGSYVSASKYNTAASALLRSRLSEDWQNTANMAEGFKTELNRL